MNKKQIIKLLDKEVGLFIENEDENSLGELYLKSIDFKKAKEVLQEIMKLRKEIKDQVKFYKQKIEKNDKGYYIKLDNKTILKDKFFNFDGDLIFLDPKNLIITNCVFQNK